MSAPSTAGRRGVPKAAVLVVSLTVATALSALGPVGSAPRTSLAGPARAADAQSVRDADGRDAPQQVTQDPAAATAAPRPAAGAADVPRAAVATTMSYDEPIQGGLTAHQAQAASTALLAAHDGVDAAAAGPHWTPAMGRTALERARSWLGMPYSWAGGAASGPTAGRCDAANGADLDCHIVGFDCSGLMMYAWGAYTSLPHFAQTQRDAGLFHPSVEQLRAGDLVFFSGYLPDGIGHVAIYEGKGMVIEAPQSGAVVRRSALADLMANDGTYRGAVRPLTPATPTLAATAGRASRAGGTVTLRGTGLAGVTSVTVGDRTRRVGTGSDSTIRIAVPRAATGTRAVTVTVTTSWGATSAPLTLRYADPAASRPVTRAPVPPATSAPEPAPGPSKSAPKPTPSPTKSAPKPTPSPTKSAPKPTPSTSSTQAVPSPALPDGSATGATPGT